MDWLRQNGFWVVILVIFIAAHLFGHGGHGSHGGHGGDEDGRRPRQKGANEPQQPTRHQH